MYEINYLHGHPENMFSNSQIKFIMARIVKLFKRWIIVLITRAPHRINSSVHQNSPRSCQCHHTPSSGSHTDGCHTGTGSWVKNSCRGEEKSLFPLRTSADCVHFSTLHDKLFLSTFSLLTNVRTLISGSCPVRPMWSFLNKTHWNNYNKNPRKINAALYACRGQAAIIFMLFTYNSWSHLTGLDNQVGHHTAKQQGYSDLSHTGMNLVNTARTLTCLCVCVCVVCGRQYFNSVILCAVSAHQSLFNLSSSHSCCHGHISSSQWCTSKFTFRARPWL